MNSLFLLKRWYGNLANMGNPQVLFVVYKEGEWRKMTGHDVPEGWLCWDMGAQTKLFVNKRVEAQFLELTSSFEFPMDFARNWNKVAKIITKRLNAHLNLRQRIVLRCKSFFRSFVRNYKIVSDLSMYETLKDDWL